MASEFDLIRRHFTRPTRHTLLGIGDDAALLQPGEGMALAVSSDMLVAGTHFFPDTDPQDLGWKTLAVNVSDLAAMGARPRWATLAIALPTADPAWLEAFAEGFFACATRFDIDLVGGDTTRGPLNLAVTIMGEVPPAQAVTRAGARAGDELWISGSPGRAALGLAHLRGELQLAPLAQADCIAALQRPMPRLALGLALRGLATAMLDVSDGLAGDLGHILAASGVSAILEQDALPLRPLLDAGASGSAALAALLGGGDDYELLFTAPAGRHAAVLRQAAETQVAVTRIGRIGPAGEPRLQLRDAAGRLTAPGIVGYDHFRAGPSGD